MGKKFGIVPREVPKISSMALCAPRFVKQVDILMASMVERGHDPVVFESLRTQERQAYLYGFGRRYDDGRGVVTKAVTAMDGWHFFGLAVDIISRKRLWDDSYVEFWTDLRILGTETGLCSGNDWDRDNVPGENDPDEHFHDKPHIQWWCTGMTIKPLPVIRNLYEQGGREAVWRHLRAA
jgi:hypothetical protein